MDPVEPTIYELMRRVREHPDFAFGVVFTTEDFANGVIPDDFSATVIEDLLIQRGNEYVAENYERPEGDRECVHCGAEAMEDQHGPCFDWCGCHSEQVANCHLLHWINPETGKCEHPSHDEEA